MPVPTAMRFVPPRRSAACTSGSRPMASGIQMAPYPSSSSSAATSRARATGWRSRVNVQMPTRPRSISGHPAGHEMRTRSTLGIVAGESDVSVTTDRDERLLIGGEWVAGGDGGYEIVNPATEDVVGLAPEASVQQAREA